MVVARREGARARKARALRIVSRLHELYPAATTALDHRGAFELLVATILSAQCTDARVNLVTPALFDRFPDAAALASADRAEVEALIHSTGFFRNKAKALVELGRALVERHGGEVPSTMEELVVLPGVGRKTASVVLGTWFGVPALPVDTHVTRLAGRLGLSVEEDPARIERDLAALVPREEWIGLAHGLVLHGRALCTARKPRCGECPVAPDCPSASLGS